MPHYQHTLTTRTTQPRLIYKTVKYYQPKSITLLQAFENKKILSTIIYKR